MAKTNFFFRLSVMVVTVAVLVTSLPALSRPGYAQTVQPSGNILLVPPSSIKEGTPLACVYNYVRQGVPVQQALDQCDFAGSSMKTPAERDVDSYLGGIDGSSTGTQVGSVSCSSNNGNPQISKSPNLKPLMTDSPTPPDDPNLPKTSEGADITPIDDEYQELKNKAEKAWDEYYKLSQIYKEQVQNGYKPSEELNDALDQARKEAQDAVNERDEYSADKYGPTWWKKLFGVPERSNSNDGGSQMTDPNAEDPCQQANQFISECNASGWKTSPCGLWLDKMKGCSDPLVTDPSPESAQEPDEGGGSGGGGESSGRSCDEFQVDPEKVERVVTLMCSSKVNPADPDQDPCAPVELEATVLRSDIPLKQGDPCGSPKALTTEDQCVHSGTDPKVIYMKFREKDIEEATKKLGGPGFVIPMPQQNPPCGDCPQPDPGGPISPDSESGEPGSGPNPDLP